jgi:choline dehydrogenase
VLGGSSAINGLLYIRGQPQDYDHWRQLGNAGWTWDEVLPYFMRAEDQERGADAYHGVGGPLGVSNMRVRRDVCDAFISGATQCGIPARDDFNREDNEGAGYFQLTARNGFRCSTASGYLKPVRRRSNLTVVTKAHVERICFDARRATGVVYRQSGRSTSVLAQQDVILSAGAVGSPQLLQLSGVGPGALLQRLGIPVVHALPGVGRNLQDHLQIRSMSMGASQVAAFAKTDPMLETPDIQFHFQPLSADKPGSGLHRYSAFTSSVCQLRPESRGFIEIRSPDASIYPEIHPNYLSTSTDQKITVAGMKFSRRICSSAAMAPFVDEELLPGPHVQGDEALLQCAREIGQTIYHPVGTCKMGSDIEAVVDERLRVRGIDCLRVVDASIMPSITSGNTNAPTIMIAEKAADMILDDGGGVRQL